LKSIAICLHFELVTVIGTVATYRYGNCSDKLDGLFGIDLYQLLIQKTTSEDTPISQIVKLLNHNQSQSKANKPFSKIVNHYREYQKYPT
jgi:hypothetical protein